MSITPRIETLSNGVRVVTTPLEGAQSVSVSLFVGAGSRSEDARHNGLFHFLEHMLFKGTESRPDPIQIGETIEGVGGVLNAYTTKELTCYWNRVPYDRLDLAIEVLADMLTHSLLAPGEIDRERGVVQQEIRRGHDQPASWTAELLSRAAYGDSPMGRSIAGTLESVENVDRDAFVEHIARWYVPERLVLSVGGNADHSHVVELANRYLGGIEATSVSDVEAAPRLTGRQLLTDWRDIEQANLAISFAAFAREDPDRFPLLVLNTVLGRGMSSRLFREVRERRGLAYSVGSGVSRYHDTGSLSISAGVSPEKAAEATSVILEECRRLIDEPVGEDEMTKARDFAIGNFRLSLETPMALGQRAGELLLLDGDIEPVEQVVDRIAAVTADDVRRVARRVFDQEAIAMAAVGKVDEAGLDAAIATRAAA